MGVNTEYSFSEKTGLEDALVASWLEPKWYVLFVRSNQEKRVVQHLDSRAVEHFLPLWKSVRQWQQRKVKLMTPLFPGYVFVRLSLADRLKALLVPNVVNFVGAKNTPAIIADQEIKWIRKGVEHGNVEPHPYSMHHLKAGDAVMIQSGAMTGMEGTLIRMQNSTRVLVQVDAIARAFIVEVDACDLGVVKPSANFSII
jgi:transcription antitermination factor NusG